MLSCPQMTKEKHSPLETADGLDAKWEKYHKSSAEEHVICGVKLEYDNDFRYF